MNMELTAFLVSNFYFNAAVGFLFSVIIVEFFLFIFRLRSPRAVMLLRMVPFLKVLWDIVFHYTPASWAIANGIDIVNRLPMSMSMVMNAGIQNFLPFVSFKFTIYQHFAVSPADMLTQNIGPLATGILVGVLALGGLVSLAWTIFRLVRSVTEIRSITRNSRRIFQATENKKLALQLEKRRVEILLSDTEGVSPFSCGTFRLRIVIPAALWDSLSGNEKDALLTHELGHLAWKDVITGTALQLWTSLFWFIPFCRAYSKAIDTERERSCDLSCRDYSIPLSEMASVIANTLRSIRSSHAPISAAALVGRNKNPAMERVKYLLSEDNPAVSRTGVAITLVQAFIVFAVTAFILNSRFYSL